MERPLTMFDTPHFRPAAWSVTSATQGMLSPIQDKWRIAAEGLAADVLRHRAVMVDRDAQFPKDNLHALAEAGLLALRFPERWGGGGSDVTTSTAVTEALAGGCASTAMCYHMHTSALALITALADEEQVDAIVRPLMEGAGLATYATSEPGSGSRWWHLDSHAVRDDGGYVINALKSFVTSAGHADLYVIPVRATPFSHANELSIFAVPGNTPGIVPVGTWDAMGLRGNASTPVRFDQCRVPLSARLGPSGHGFALLMAYALPVFQVGLAAVYLGVARSAFESAIAHVTTRIHADTGQSLATVEAVQRHIAEMKLRLDQARLTIYHVAGLIDRMTAEQTDLIDAVEDNDFIMTVAAVKIVACEAAVAICDRAVQVCGGVGYKRGHVVERAYRDARAGSVMGPNDDALKSILGQRLLGMPFPWE